MEPTTKAHMFAKPLSVHRLEIKMEKSKSNPTLRTQQVKTEMGTQLVKNIKLTKITMA